VVRHTRSRLSLAVAFGLLLITLGGGSTLGSTSVSTSLARATVVAPHAFPASSCQGTNACDGVTGTVGTNSCNGDHACYYAAQVGNHSCVGDHACDTSLGTVGNGSCNGLSACDHLGGNVGNDSCNNDPQTPLDATCPNATGPIGDYACNGPFGDCANAGAVPDCGGNYIGFLPTACLATRTVMGSSEVPAVAGQSVTVWATVFARYPVLGNPPGTVQFRVDGRLFGAPVTINRQGRAVITLTFHMTGVHWVSGRYLGDHGFFRLSSAVPLCQRVVR
jgi:hypothetical protein